MSALFPLSRFAGLAMLAAGLMPLSPAAQTNDAASRFVEVTGTATVSAPPDIGWVSVGVTTQKSDAAAAMDENAEAMRTLFEIIAEAGIDARDVQTNQISLFPVWERESARIRAPEISAYQVQNGVTVMLRDINMLGPLLDRLVKGGARQITGIGFGVEDQEALLVEARRAAMADAIARAELYATMAGATLGPVLTIREAAQFVSPYAHQTRAVTVAEAVPVAPGEADISASVSVVFALE